MPGMRFFRKKRNFQNKRSSRARGTLLRRLSIPFGKIFRRSIETTECQTNYDAASELESSVRVCEKTEPVENNKAFNNVAYPNNNGSVIFQKEINGNQKACNQEADNEKMSKQLESVHFDDFESSHIDADGGTKLEASMNVFENAETFKTTEHQNDNYPVICQKEIEGNRKGCKEEADRKQEGEQLEGVHFDDFGSPPIYGEIVIDNANSSEKRNSDGERSKILENERLDISGSFKCCDVVCSDDDGRNMQVLLDAEEDFDMQYEGKGGNAWFECFAYKSVMDPCELGNHTDSMLGKVSGNLEDFTLILQYHHSCCLENGNGAFDCSEFDDSEFDGKGRGDGDGYKCTECALVKVEMRRYDLKCHAGLALGGVSGYPIDIPCIRNQRFRRSHLRHRRHRRHRRRRDVRKTMKWGLKTIALKLNLFNVDCVDE